MDNIFHVVYSLSFYDQNQLNYNHLSKGGKNGKKALAMNGLKLELKFWVKNGQKWPECAGHLQSPAS